jgi:hypothetical protein
MATNNKLFGSIPCTTNEEFLGGSNNVLGGSGSYHVYAEK